MNAKKWENKIKEMEEQARVQLLKEIKDWKEFRSNRSRLFNLSDVYCRAAKNSSFMELSNNINIPMKDIPSIIKDGTLENIDGDEVWYEAHDMVEFYSMKSLKVTELEEAYQSAFNNKFLPKYLLNGNPVTLRGYMNGFWTIDSIDMKTSFLYTSEHRYLNDALKIKVI